MFSPLICDLIDTLWNVKGGLTSWFRITSTRFNRYIVECKDRPQAHSFETISDLIDTLWNVKDSLWPLHWLQDVDLIDTLWNVKAVVVCVIIQIVQI